jgi:hypothetical protein
MLSFGRFSNENVTPEQCPVDEAGIVHTSHLPGKRRDELAPLREMLTRSFVRVTHVDVVEQVCSPGHGLGNKEAASEQSESTTPAARDRPDNLYTR